LLISGIGRQFVPKDMQDALAVYVIIFSIGLTEWPKYARTVRGATLVEKSKEYVQAARVIGVSSFKIMVSHVLPNVLGPVLVIATLNIANAIISEATLSFLGVGMPPTQPSLGTLISDGQNYLLAGQWWITLFPGIALIVMVISVNLVGDWLRDALNPKLR
jgi:peptide/nickel transport system permease protein